MKIIKFEPVTMQNVLPDRMTIVFHPETLIIKNPYTGLDAKNTKTVVLFACTSTNKIVNSNTPVDLEVIANGNKLTMNVERIKWNTDLQERISEFIENNLRELPVQDKEALEIIKYMENLNREIAINAALDSGDKELFMKLTGEGV